MESNTIAVILSAAKDLLLSHAVPNSRSFVASLLRMTGVLAALAAPLAAQQAAATIDSGMTQAQVVAKLGQPLSVRSSNGHTYLFYKNGCEKTCGINDLVVLDSGKVVDAVFRSPDRKYTGKSSSPAMVPAEAARKGKGTAVKTSEPSTKKPPL